MTQHNRVNIIWTALMLIIWAVAFGLSKLLGFDLFSTWVGCMLSMMYFWMIRESV